MTDRAPQPTDPLDGRDALAIAGLAFIILFIYAGSFDVPFHYDDEVVILDPRLQDPTDIATVSAFNRFRTIANLSLALQWRFAGTLTWPYHLVNLLLHLGAASLVFLLGRELLRTPFALRHPARGTLRWMPVLGAFLFAAHPLQTQAVTYIVQGRYVPSATICYLGGLLLYLRWRATGSRLAFAGTSAALVLGLGCKEIIVSLPAALLLVELLFVGGRSGWRRAALPAAIFAPFLLAGIAVRYIRSDGVGATMSAVLAPPALPFDGLDYLRTSPGVLLDYLGMLLLPRGQSLIHDVPVRRAVDAGVVLSTAGVVAVLLVAALLLVLSRRWSHRPEPEDATPASSPPSEPPSVLAIPITPLGDRPLIARLVSFGIFWFFLTIALESSFIPLLDPMVEHRVYLPSVGFFIAFVATIAALERLAEAIAGRLGGRRVSPLLGPVALAILIALHAALAVRRNEVWGSWRTLWLESVRAGPRLAKPLHNLGTGYEREGQLEAAMACYDRALAIHPRYGSAWANRSWLQTRLARRARRHGHEARARALLGRAVREARRALAIEDAATTWNFLGLALLDLGETAAATEAFRQAATESPGWDLPAIHLAMAATRAGDPAAALARLDPILAATPNHPYALLQQARALRALGRTDEANAALAEAIDRRPDFAEARADLAAALGAGVRGSERGEGLEPLRAAAARFPGSPELTLALARALADSGRGDEARATLEAARTRLPLEPGILHALAGLAPPDASLVLLERAAVLDRLRARRPDERDADILHDLAAARRRAGDRPGALEADRAFVEAAPDADPRRPAAAARLDPRGVGDPGGDPPDRSP